MRTTNPPLDFSNIIETAELYDHIFCSGTEVIDVLRKQGCRDVNWLPYAADPEHHHPVDVSDEDEKRYKKDIALVGSFYPNRAEALEVLADLDIGIWGPYWRFLDPGSPLADKAVDRKLNYSEWIKIYSLAKIVIVVHYNDMKTPCDQASPKLFEALACGSFVLCDKQKDAMSLFEDGRHLVFFDGADDLRDKVVQYLRTPEERNRIASAGREEVLTKYTYRHRMEEMLSSVEV